MFVQRFIRSFRHKVRSLALIASIAAAIVGCTAPTAPPPARNPLDVVAERLTQIASESPSTVTVHNVAAYRDAYLPVIEIDPAPGVSQPRVQIVAALHGDEQLSTEIAIALAEHVVRLTTEGGALPEVHVVPVANPSGYSGGTRENAAGTDLNRNFPWAWRDGSTHGAGPASEAATKDIVAHTLRQGYVLSISLHAGAFGITHPWDYIGTGRSSGLPNSYDTAVFQGQYEPFHEWAQKLSESYRDALSATPTISETAFFVREGYDWYPAYGTFTDWVYGVAGTPAFTVELHPDKGVPTATQVAATWAVHRDALLGLIETAGTADEVAVETGVAHVAILDAAEEVSAIAADPPMVPAGSGYANPVVYYRHTPVPAGAQSVFVLLRPTVGTSVAARRVSLLEETSPTAPPESPLVVLPAYRRRGIRPTLPIPLIEGMVVSYNNGKGAR